MVLLSILVLFETGYLLSSHLSQASRLAATKTDERVPAEPSTEVPATAPAKTKNPVIESPKPAVPAVKPDKDAIKNFDYKNSFAPAFDEPNCTEQIKRYGNGASEFRKTPDSDSECWYQIVDGKSKEIAPALPPLVPENTPWLNFDALDEQPLYEDLNGDGFTDIFVRAGGTEFAVDIAFILNPSDLQHPYAAIIGSGQDIISHPKYVGNSTFEIEIDENMGSCPMVHYRIQNDSKGVPQIVDYHDYNEPDGGTWCK